MKKPLIKSANDAIRGKIVKCQTDEKKKWAYADKNYQNENKKMLLSTSKGDKLNFTCIKGIRFMFLYKCKVALTNAL